MSSLESETITLRAPLTPLYYMFIRLYQDKRPFPDEVCVRYGWAKLWVCVGGFCVRYGWAKLWVCVGGFCVRYGWAKLWVCVDGCCVRYGWAKLWVCVGGFLAHNSDSEHGNPYTELSDRIEEILT